MTYKEHMDQEYNRGLEDGEIKGRVLARNEDGMPIAEIAKKSGISEDEVKTILKDEGLI